MTQMLLTRRSHDARPTLPVLGDIALVKGRVHECAGRARRTFAMAVAAQVKGPVFWISPKWDADQLNPDGMAPFVRPQDFTFLTPRRAEDILWTMEEVLRAGAVPLVVADIPGLPSLTPVRRMHLAAETGAVEGGVMPLGLLLTPGAGGAQGVESRWQMEPVHRPDRTGWTLTRTRARTDPVRTWQISQRDQGLQVADPAAG